ncbi:MAG: zinc-binding dehydrogenase, partial [Gemmatimonadales bacterium]
PGHGCFAGHTIVRATVALAKPDEITFADAATIPVAAATSYDGTHQIELRAGQTLLILGIGGGDALWEVAGLATDPSRIISAADPATAIELGGSALKRSTEATAKIADVIKYGLVDPHVSARFPLERAGEAIAAVESGHATGKVIVEIVSA